MFEEGNMFSRNSFSTPVVMMLTLIYLLLFGLELDYIFFSYNIIREWE